MTHSVATINDIHQIEQIPFSQYIAGIQSTYDCLLNSAKSHPNKTALRFLLYSKDQIETSVYSYQALLSYVNQTANALHALGVTKNDVVSVLLPNLPQTHFAFLGVQAVGILNPINPLLEPTQIISILNSVKAKVLITLGPSPSQTDWEQKIQHLLNHVPSLKNILTVQLERFITKHFTPHLSETIPVLDFDDVLSKQKGAMLNFTPKFDPNSIACYFHTGGTTGMPKLATLTHLNILHTAWAGGCVLDFTPDDILLGGLPLFHIFAAVVTCIIPFMVGAEVVLLTPQGFRGEGVISSLWKVVSAYNITILIAVPTIFKALSLLPLQENISSLKFAISGSTALPNQILQDFEKNCGVPILEGYGMTEGSCISSVNPRHGQRRIGSAGLRIPFQQLKSVILDKKGNFLRDALPNELGHLVIKGPNVFQGYKDVPPSWIQDGWFNTGDMGRIDTEGYCWITGRSKDLIIRGGHNIDPQIIEESLYQHPDVLAVAAIGKPDPRVGEVPVAYVSLKEKNSITAEALLNFAQEKVPEQAAVPKEIIIIDEMPTTAVGKIFKPALRNHLIKQWLTQKILDLSNEPLGFKIEIKTDPITGQLIQVTFSSLTPQSVDLIEKFKHELNNYTLNIEVIYSAVTENERLEPINAF